MRHINEFYLLTNKAVSRKKLHQSQKDILLSHQENTHTESYRLHDSHGPWNEPTWYTHCRLPESRIPGSGQVSVEGITFIHSGGQHHMEGIALLIRQPLVKSLCLGSSSPPGTYHHISLQLGSKEWINFNKYSGRANIDHNDHLGLQYRYGFSMSEYSTGTVTCQVLQLTLQQKKPTLKRKMISVTNSVTSNIHTKT